MILFETNLCNSYLLSDLSPTNLSYSSYLIKLIPKSKLLNCNFDSLCINNYGWIQVKSKNVDSDIRLSPACSYAIDSKYLYLNFGNITEDRYNKLYANKSIQISKSGKISLYRVTKDCILTINSYTNNQTSISSDTRSNILESSRSKAPFKRVYNLIASDGNIYINNPSVSHIVFEIIGESSGGSSGESGDIVDDNGNVSIGTGASGTGVNAIAIGTGAKSTSGAIQIGSGVNTEPGTFKVGEFTLMNQDGSINSDRIPLSTNGGLSINQNGELGIDNDLILNGGSAS